MSTPDPTWPETVRFAVAGQVFDLPWALSDDGKVVVDGDMVLGTPEELFPSSDPLAANRMASFVPYPFNEIPYAFDTDLTPGQRDAADRALNLISMYTPVQFTELPAGSTGFGGIRFRKGNTSDFWCWSELGYQGPSKTTNVTINSCGNQASPGSDPGVALLHELGHALGLLHEHQRWDAAAHVDYDSSCVDMPFPLGKSRQFDPKGDALGPYEISSIMHYGSYYFSKRNLPDFHPDAVHRAVSDAEIVLPIDSRFHVGTTSPIMQDVMDPEGSVGNWEYNTFRYRVDYDDGTYSASFQANDMTGTGFGVYPQVRLTQGSEFALVLRYSTVTGALPSAGVAALDDANNWTIVDDPDQAEPDCPALLRAGQDFSDPDAMIGTNSFLHTPGTLSALWQMYGGSTDRDGPPAFGDRFATGFAWGDFDGDTLLDLAVSNPSQHRVVIYRGAYGAPTAETTVLPMESIMVTGAETLAAGDFNGDGYDDLAVGTPSMNASGGSAVEAGGLVVLMGSDAGLDHGREPVSVHSELNERKGAPIGVRPRTSGELANVWHLHPAQDATVAGVLTGVPVNLHDGATTSAYSPASGTDWRDAELEDISSFDCDKTTVLSDLFSTSGSRVGAALHVADLNLDGRDDLLVGAPGGDSHLDATDAIGNSLPGFRRTGVVLVLWGNATGEAIKEPLYLVDVLTPYTPEDYGTSLPLHRGSHQDSEFGSSLSVGDVSGNGCPDVIVGAHEDYALLSGVMPLETDGDHRGSTTNTPGRAWVYEGGVSGNACGYAFTSGDIPGASPQCYPRFRAWDALEEPTGETDADFGYDVDYGSVTTHSLSVHPLVLVGAPGTDSSSQPPVMTAGAVWSFRYTGTGITAQRLDEDSVGSGGRRVAGFGPAPNERFGTSIAYDDVRGLLVGVPDVTGPTGGAVDWFEHDAITGWVPSPSEPAGSSLLVSGFRANEVLTTRFGAEFGHDVAWVPWEGGSTTAPGFVVAAPGARLALPGVQTGALIGIRGSGSALGAAYSTVPSELMMVTQ